MTIESLGRSAADAARRKAAREVDPTLMLRRMHRTHRARVAGAAAAAAVVVALGALAVRQLGPGTTDRQVPGGTPSPSARGSDACQNPGITCLGGGRLRAALPVPVTLAQPDGFDATQTWHLIGRDSVEGYRLDVDNTGVTVMEGAVPVRDDGTWTRDPAAGTTATSVAQWLANRPFLQNAQLIQTVVGGLPAWRVTGSLRPGAPLPASKSPFAVAPTFRADEATAGYATNLTGDYTVLDVPGAGLTVIWSWTTSPGDPTVVQGSQSTVDALSFGAP
jgi:hypothetical protein